MRIGFVKDAVYPWEKGGAQKRNWEVARRLADDHDVHLFGMQYWDGPRRIERDGVMLHGVCPARPLYTDGRRSIRQALYFSRHVTSSLLSHELDVIDCQKSSLFPIFSSKINSLFDGSLLVGMWTEIWGDYWYHYLGEMGFFGKIIERFAVRLPDINIAISEFVAREMRRIGRTDGIRVVHNGVDYEEIQDVGPASERWDVVYVGRLSKHKRVDLLLEAIEILTRRQGKQIRCGIIGDGPEREELERYSSDLGVTNFVDFLGFLDEYVDVIRHMKAASVYVLPSEREGFPNTILEANACGVPTIIADSDRNGGTEIVESGTTGFIVRPEAAAFAEHIDKVLSDDNVRGRLAANARRFAKRHDWSTIVDETEDVYLSNI